MLYSKFVLFETFQKSLLYLFVCFRLLEDVMLHSAKVKFWNIEQNIEIRVSYVKSYGWWSGWEYMLSWWGYLLSISHVLPDFPWSLIQTSHVPHTSHVLQYFSFSPILPCSPILSIFPILQRIPGLPILVNQAVRSIIHRQSGQIK